MLQAEDGIRDRDVTGVQTCALPIYPHHMPTPPTTGSWPAPEAQASPTTPTTPTKRGGPFRSFGSSRQIGPLVRVSPPSSSAQYSYVGCLNSSRKVVGQTICFSALRQYPRPTEIASHPNRRPKPPCRGRCGAGTYSWRGIVRRNPPVSRHRANANRPGRRFDQPSPLLAPPWLGDCIA